MYARSKGEAERLVVAQDGGGLTTVIVRPRLIWGAGDSVHLPRFAAAVRDGSFRWIDGGRYLTSTCHVRNVCTGMILAAERGRGGEVYFLTDGPPLPYRQFVRDLLATQGLLPPENSMPGWVARARAGVGELRWRLLRRDGAPPLTNTAVRLLGTEVTVSDEKARGELGYDSPVDRQRGLEEMRASAPS